MLNYSKWEDNEKVVLCKDNMNIDFLNIDEINVVDANNLVKSFNESYLEIIDILLWKITLDSLGKIEEIIKNFLIEEWYYIYNFEFSKELKSQILFLNNIALDDRNSYLKIYFLNSFYRFLLWFDFWVIPNTKDWKLIAYLDLYETNFKFSYKKWLNRGSKLQELVDGNKNSMINLLKNYDIDDEINEKIEYNNYILEEMIEFIDMVYNNKSINSLDITVSKFKNSYKDIVTFIDNNKEKIIEIWTYDETLKIVNNLFVHYSTWNFKNLNTFEAMIENNMKKFFEWQDDIVFNWLNFNDDFYSDLKFSLYNFINILNKDIVMKKNNF